MSGPRLRVYVSGPYTADIPEAVEVTAAIKAGQHLLKAGFAPLIPHLSHYWHERHPNHWEEWIELDLAWIAVSDAILRLPGPSRGTAIECALADRLGIPIYDSIEKLIENPPVRDERFLLRRIGRLHGAKQADYGTDQDPFANVRGASEWGIEPWGRVHDPGITRCGGCKRSYARADWRTRARRTRSWTLPSTP